MLKEPSGCVFKILRTKKKLKSVVVKKKTPKTGQFFIIQITINILSTNLPSVNKVTNFGKTKFMFKKKCYDVNAI